MKKFIKFFMPIIDIVFSPFVYPAALLLKCIRRIGVHRLPFCKKVLLHVGVFPIRNHYYEPLFDERQIKYPLSDNRNLPGIDWNIQEQLKVLDCFNFSKELNDVSTSKSDHLTFYMNNDTFQSGDAEYWYNLIRWKKPNRIIEVGSGYSTLMAIKAIKKIKRRNQIMYASIFVLSHTRIRG